MTLMKSSAATERHSSLSHAIITILTRQSTIDSAPPVLFLTTISVLPQFGLYSNLLRSIVNFDKIERKATRNGRLTDLTDRNRIGEDRSSTVSCLDLSLLPWR